MSKLSLILHTFSITGLVVGLFLTIYDYGYIIYHIILYYRSETQWKELKQ